MSRAILDLRISHVELHGAAADLSVGAEELGALVQQRLARLAAGAPPAALAAGHPEVAHPHALADAVAREVWQSVRGHLEAGAAS